MAGFRAVLDACVLFPPTLLDTLLRAAERQLYQPILSQAILDELTRNLIKRSKKNTSQAQALQEAIKEAFPESLFSPPDALIRNMTNDPKDRHVAATAVFSLASVIVTSNLKDFPASSLTAYDIEAQTPDTFLMYLYDLAPSVMIDIIRQQAADKKNPPRSASNVLSRLETFAPTFCEKCRPAIVSLER